MTQVLKSAAKWLAILLMLMALAYVGAYLALVKRVELVNMAFFHEAGSEMHRHGRRVGVSGSIHTVYPEAPAFLSLRKWPWHVPLARLDDAFLRPRRWQSYLVMLTTNGSEIVYLPQWHRSQPLPAMGPTTFVEMLRPGTSPLDVRFSGPHLFGAGDETPSPPPERPASLVDLRSPGGPVSEALSEVVNWYPLWDVAAAPLTGSRSRSPVSIDLPVRPRVVEIPGP